MAKKLSNKEKFAIQEGLRNNKTITQLAKEFDVKESLIEAYLDGLFAAMAKVEEERKATADKAKKPTAGDLMINKTRDKKAGGVAIMTREASEHGDKFKESLSKANSPKHDNAIGVINPNKK